MAATIANVEMAKAWDGDEGEDWARDWQRYDRVVRAHHRRLLDAAAIRAGEQVLDVGCGNGQSTRDAARATGDGTALGVDLSSQMIERSREMARAEGLTNARFEQADAQVHPFEPESYDVVLSRFGAMFFGDAPAAFRNLALATRPGGRLAMVAWRTLADNEWLRCIFAALAAGRDLPSPPPGAPGPFGLADPDLTTATLTAAGYEEVGLEPLDAPLWAGADGDDAFGFFRGTGVTRGMLQGLEETDRASALDALRATMVAHDTGDGVLFGSGAWLISARRPVR
jgi:SAM-dependent methyltransferase